ncbi:MAG TPA: dTMP kinase [Vicinamibacterales bacterium]|nr:dTMP kinase [Vicinamibacterales bacterium]
MNVADGMLIAFEGLDQSGKETQARRLADDLAAAGRRVEIVSFPDYATAIGAELHGALHGGRDYGADVIQMLMIANRYERKPAIEASLGRGDIVLADRYLASSVAYGEAQGLDPEWLREVQKYLPQPALTLMIDISPETAARRKRVHRDRFERDLEMLARVRASYRRQAAAPGWHAVDGERTVEAVAADVARLADQALARR